MSILVYTKRVKTAVKKWGNSLGFRIPKGVADRLNLEDGTPIELELVAGGILLKPVKLRRSRYSMDELLEGVSRKTIHPLEDEKPVGREVW